MDYDLSGENKYLSGKNSTEFRSYIVLFICSVKTTGTCVIKFSMCVCLYIYVCFLKGKTYVMDKKRERDVKPISFGNSRALEIYQTEMSFCFSFLYYLCNLRTRGKSKGKRVQPLTLQSIFAHKISFINLGF